VVGLFHLQALKYTVLGQRHPILPEMRFLSLDKVLEFIPFPPINMVKQKDAGSYKIKSTHMAQFLIEHTMYLIELFEEGLGCVTSLPKCISDHLQLILLLLLCMKTWMKSLHQKNSTLHLTHHPQLDVCPSALDLKHLMTWRGFWNQAPWLPIFLFLLYKYSVQIECFSQFLWNA